MPPTPEEFFVTFPRQPLPANISRRELFATLLAGMQAESAKQDGQAVFRLEDLGALPDVDLATIVPIIPLDCQIRPNEGFYWARTSKSVKARQLFLAEPAIEFVLSMINGMASLGDISQKLAARMNWQEERAFAYVRGLFLSLVFVHVCYPNHPLKR
jgi:hypothetical protein